MKKLVIISLIFFGCGEWEGELITSDYQPELNIFGLLHLTDEYGSFMKVSRTATLEENVRTINISGNDLIIENAEVFIYDEFGDTTFFEFTSGRYTSYGFVPLQNTIYYLNVNDFENGLFATGELITPQIVELQLENLADTLILNELFQINWNSTQSPVEISLTEFNIHSSFHYCIEREKYYYMDGESSDYFDMDLCDFYDLWDIVNEDVHSGLSIALRTFDLNYYNYFILNDDDEFINFIMGNPGSTAKSFGIYGGLGVFGAISQDSEDRILKLE